VAPDPTGDKVDDHVLIENHGPDDATDVVLHETVPPGAIAETATADQGMNFAPRAAATAVDVPPAPVACASRAHPPPRAKIAG
jgi:uncharacterized repeat protein (TIGR01451 family)